MTNHTLHSTDETRLGAGHYAEVNGLKMYYESHGSGDPPLVLLHGAFSATGTSFGQVLPLLAKNRRVISVEQQGHGRTGDIDRPLSTRQMAEDTAALLRQIGVEQADLFGYSMGAGIALEMALKQPGLVRKLVLASIYTNKGGAHPGIADGMEQMEPEMLHGSTFHEEYLQTAPNPENFATLFKKIQQMDSSEEDWPEAALRSLQAPTLLMIGDSDIVRPEHAVETFRLLGGGVAGDVVGLPKSRLAVLPGTTHITIVYRAEWLASMVNDFLDEPMPENQ
jgi:pimeloyl-ACP methyl ester carboxylesterase